MRWSVVTGFTLGTWIVREEPACAIRRENREGGTR
jgi:hypothetical protein